MISHDNKFIFIHIPKTAGQSVWYMLQQGMMKEKFQDMNHTYMIDWRDKMGEKTKDYFSFCFVRNPYDRFVSAYSYLKKGGVNHLDRISRDKYIKPFNSFKDLVMNMDKVNLLEQQHFRPQYNYVYDRNGNIIVDFIGDFNNVDRDFTYICYKIAHNSGIELSEEGMKNLEIDGVLRLNSSHHKPYHEYYDDETYSVIRERYKRDFELLEKLNYLGEVGR